MNIHPCAQQSYGLLLDAIDSGRPVTTINRCYINPVQAAGRRLALLTHYHTYGSTYDGQTGSYVLWLDGEVLAR